MITPAERITFIIARTVVALALVAAGVFCIYRGINFWSIPRQDASQLGLDVLGFHLSAGGLGGVIFGAGIAMCFFAYKTAPKGIEQTHKTDRSDPPSNRTGGGGSDVIGRVIRETTDKTYLAKFP